MSSLILRTRQANPAAVAVRRRNNWLASMEFPGYTLPFVAGLAFHLVSPPLTGLVKDRVRASIDNADGLSNRDASVPAHLSAPYIGDYLTFVVDATSVVPATLLPLLGVALAWVEHVDSVSLLLILSVAVPGLLVLWVQLLRTGPVEYSAKQYLGGRFTLVPLVGMMVNLVALILLLVAAPRG